MVYIGIDIAKFNHFASVVSSDGEVIVKPFSFENSRIYVTTWSSDQFNKTNRGIC